MTGSIVTFEFEGNVVDARELDREIRRIIAEAKLSPEEVRLAEGATRDGGLTIALIGLAGAALGALIKGLCDLAKAKGSQTVKIKGKDGEVQVPAGTPQQQIDIYIQQAQRLSYPQISLPAPGQQVSPKPI